MINAEVVLIHIVHSGWIKNLLMSILAFDIAQFFLSLNHQVLALILEKADFNIHIIKFFSNYLIGRKMNYFWNNFTLPIFDVNVGVGQGPTLSLVLYLSLFLYIIENYLKT